MLRDKKKEQFQSRKIYIKTNNNQNNKYQI